MENQGNNYTESKIRRVLFNEVTLFIALVGAISGIIFWVANPQKSLELQVVKLQTQIEANESIASKLQNIKDNDLHELQLKMDQIEGRQIEILQALSRLEAVHGIAPK
jgi:hypothetical protein